MKRHACKINNADTRAGNTFIYTTQNIIVRGRNFICEGERADARRHALRGTAGGVTATRPIAPNGFERKHTPARQRGGTIGRPLLCPAQHLGRPQT